MGEAGADFIEQAEAVLRDHLHQGAAGGTVVVEFNPGWDLYFGKLFFGTKAVAQHAVEVGFAVQDVGHAALQASPLGQIELGSPKRGGEEEPFHDHSGGM